MNTKTTRTGFLDLLRIFACFFVIVNHTGSELFLERTPADPLWFVGISYFFIATTAVPVFLMISGYLLLGRNDSWKTTFRRIFRILCTLLGCAVLYSVYNVLRSDAAGSPVSTAILIVKEITKVYLRSPSNALWYLYTYLGILIMLPFLQKMAAAMQQRDYHFFFLFTGIFICTAPILQHYSSYLSLHPKFELPLFSGFVSMLFIGQYFARFGFPRTKKCFAAAICLLVITVFINVVATYLEYQKDPTEYLFFEDVTLLPITLGSACIFYLFSFVSLPGRVSAVISEIGACTFGIYLLSDLLIDLTWPVCRMAHSSAFPFFAVLAYEADLFLLGLLIAKILRKTPFINRIL